MKRNEEIILPEANQIDSEKVNEMCALRHKYENCLSDTDYAVIKASEEGTAVSSDIMEKRAEARLYIRKIDAQIAAIGRGEEPGELVTEAELKALQEKVYSDSVKAKVQALVSDDVIVSGINTFDLSAKESLAVKDLYPEWAVGLDVKVDEKYRLDDDLWQVVQAHKTQESWKPSLSTASLWKRVDEEHAGTADDPIPYAPPMQIYKDKYYTQEGVLYKCTRDSGIALSHNLAELAGTYVAKV